MPGGALYILNIVVAEELRGRGLGRQLNGDAVAKARLIGSTAIHLDTAADNAAVDFYEGMGFRPVVESRALSLPDGVALPSHLRLVMDI